MVLAMEKYQSVKGFIFSVNEKNFQNLSEMKETIFAKICHYCVKSNLDKLEQNRMRDGN